MPLYMGGSFIDSAADPTTYVEGPNLAEQSTSRTIIDKRTQVNRSNHRCTVNAVQPIDPAQVIRVDGPGTKYAAAEKRKRTKKQLESRMWALKKQNYGDSAIAKKIEDEFGIVLLPKSVASRLPKIQKEKQGEEDQRLDEEMFDWQIGEDEKLYNSVQEAEKRHNAEIARLEAKKWSDVSKDLANNMPERKYTAKACKERFDGLLDGTALLPIEIDPDQEGRHILREARIAEAKRMRAEDEVAAAAATEAVRQEKIQKKLKEIEVKRARQAQIEANKAEREAYKQVKKAIRDAKSQVVRNRKKVERDEKLKKIEWWKTRDLENMVYSYYTGRVLQRKHRSMIQNGEEEEFVSDDEQLEPTGLSAGNKRKAVVITTKRSKRGRKSENVQSSRAKKPQKESPKSTAKVTKARVSKQSLLNPRSILTLGELDLLLAKRDLTRRGAEEAHPEVVARLAAADKALEMHALEAILQAEFVPLKGSHRAKEARLQDHDARQSEAGKQGATASDLEFQKSYEGYHGKGARFIGGT